MSLILLLLVNGANFEGYDGPLQYSMSVDNPDQIISVLSSSETIERK